MANYYCDHGSYSANGDIGTTPVTWGLPQEGDGYGDSTTLASATNGRSTASSIAQTVFDTNPSAGATYSVCGVTFTAVASGATGNQFNIGASLGATLDNLATAINGGAGTAVSANVAIGTPALKNLVYARGPTLGAPTNTIQIMMRVGSTTLNYTNNSYVAISTSSWSGGVTHTQFSGGVSGVFNYLVNSSIIGVGSTYQKCTYGALAGLVFVVYTGATSPASTDILYCRSGSGKSINIVESQSASANRTFIPIGNIISCIIDSNTQWVNDSGMGIVTITYGGTQTSGQRSYFFGAANRSFSIEALVSSGLIFQFSYAGPGSTNFNIATVGNSQWQTSKFVNIVFNDDPITPQVLFPSNWNTTSNGASISTQFINCTLNRVAPSATFLPGINIGLYTSSTVKQVYENCTYNFNYQGSTTPTSLVYLMAANTNNSLDLTVLGGSITGTNGYTVPLITSVPSSSNINILSINAQNVNGLNIGMSAGSLNIPYSWFPDQRSCYFQSTSSGRSWRYENMASYSDWVYNNTPLFPTLSTTMTDGTLWSMRTAWISSMTVGIPYYAPPITKYHRMSTGTRNINIEISLPSVWGAPSMLTFILQYTNQNGQIVTENHKGTELISSSATWANLNGWSGYVTKKLNINTSQQVLQNSDVTLFLVLEGPAPASTAGFIFCDPDLILS